ncbi:DUF2490 domain-containing protein [bacterium]|nr:DUF2490 domain-containing protein [bacterium]
MKKVLSTIILILLLCSCVHGVQTAGRSWNYLSSTFTISRSLSWVLLGGIRHEFSRWDEGTSIATKGLYFNELFTGPVYVKKFGPVIGVFPVFFYYMGFPIKAADTYTYGYSLEFAPTFIYKIGKVSMSNRFIFHNKIFSNFYSEILGDASWNSGYSLMIRWKFMLQYRLSDKLIIEVAEEPFFGIIEDPDAPAVTGPGFSEKGLDMNRFYLGFIYNVNKRIGIEVNYVYETSYANDVKDIKQLTQKAHYIFLTLKTKYPLFKK